MSGKYVIHPAGNAQFHFNLKAVNSEVILTSERYTRKESALAGIEAVRTHSHSEDRFRRRRSKLGQPYFVLKSSNNEIIGTSEMYSSNAAREQGIQAVRTQAPKARVEDLTQSGA